MRNVLGPHVSQQLVWEYAVQGVFPYQSKKRRFLFAGKLIPCAKFWGLAKPASTIISYNLLTF